MCRVKENCSNCHFVCNSFDTVLYMKLKGVLGRTSPGLSNAWLSVNFRGVLMAHHTDEGVPLLVPKQSVGTTKHKSVVP